MKHAPSPIPFRAPDGRVRPSDWTLPHGSPDLSALWARRMAVCRRVAGIAWATAGRVALCDLQFPASDRAERCVPGAVCDLSRKEPGTPVCRLHYVLKLRRGLVCCVSRQAQTLQFVVFQRIRTGKFGGIQYWLWYRTRASAVTKSNSTTYRLGWDAASGCLFWPTASDRSRSQAGGLTAPALDSTLTLSYVQRSARIATAPGRRHSPSAVQRGTAQLEPFPKAIALALR